MQIPMPTSTTYPTSIITKGFLLAGAYNVVGVLVFSKLFTNALLPLLDPDVFSWLGLLAILLWGCAYWSVSKAYRQVPYLVLVFVVEKLLYTCAWVAWLSKHASRLPALFAESPLTATFFSVYGLGDFLFAIFFFRVFMMVRQR